MRYRLLKAKVALPEQEGWQDTATVELLRLGRAWPSQLAFAQEVNELAVITADCDEDLAALGFTVLKVRKQEQWPPPGYELNEIGFFVPKLASKTRIRSYVPHSKTGKPKPVYEVVHVECLGL